MSDTTANSTAHDIASAIPKMRQLQEEAVQAEAATKPREGVYAQGEGSDKTSMTR